MSRPGGLVPTWAAALAAALASTALASLVAARMAGDAERRRGKELSDQVASLAEAVERGRGAPPERVIERHTVHEVKAVDAPPKPAAPPPGGGAWGELPKPRLPFDEGDIKDHSRRGGPHPAERRFDRE